MSNIVTVYVGLDYHQDAVQVCVLDREGRQLTNRSVPNDDDAIRAATERYGKHVVAAIEACCGAAELAERLSKAGWSISLAHAGFVNRMKQNPDKTDFDDALLLADLVRIGYLPKVWLAPAELRRLRRLVPYRQQLVERRKATKLRIRALLRENRLKLPPSVNAWTQAFFAWLETAELHEEDRWLMDQHLAQLQELSRQIQESDPRLADRLADDAITQRLLSYYGVGLITAATMRAEIGRFDRFRSGKQLAKFCGISPRNASSGARQADAGLIKSGNPQLRRVLIELAQRLLWRSKGPHAAMASRLLQKGKPKNVVVAAVANRWIRWMYHQMQPESLAT